MTYPINFSIARVYAIAVDTSVAWIKKVGEDFRIAVLRGLPYCGLAGGKGTCSGEEEVSMRAQQFATRQGRATEKATPEQLWIRSLNARMPFGKVIVAIANKHARQVWAMLAHDVDYDPHACLNHPMHQQTHAH